MFVDSDYVACVCDEETFELIIGCSLVLGTNESFVMCWSDFVELPGELQSKVDTDTLYLQV